MALVAAACGDDGDGGEQSGGQGSGTTVLTPSSAQPDPNAILNFGAMQATSLDPVKQGTPCEVTQMRLIYDTLTRFDTDAQLQPMLAESWTLDSPTELTMELREDVVFQDNTPFNADAVKFNIDRVLTDPDSNTGSLLYMVESVAVVDDFTVKFTMNVPAGGPLLAALSDRAGMMISPTAFEAAGSQEAFNNAPVGSGKFVVEGEWLPVESLSLRTWDGYWDETTPAIAGIDLQDVTVDSLVNALNSGQMDLVNLDSTTQIPGVEGQPNTVVKVDSPIRPQLREFLLNATEAPLDDVRVRQAIAHALDRDAIADVMTDGQQSGTWQWFPEGWLPYDASLDSVLEYDPEKAKQLLADAGYPDGLDLPSVIGASSTSYVQQGELIQAQLKAVGINMTLDKIDTAQMVPAVFTGGPNKKGTAISAPWGSNLTADPDEWFRRYTLAEGATNNGGDEVPGVRELLDEAAATLDETVRSDLYQQAHRLVVEGVYEGVPLFFVPGIMAYKDYVGGIVRAETRCPANFLRDVYITEGKVPANEPS